MKQSKALTIKYDSDNITYTLTRDEKKNANRDIQEDHECFSETVRTASKKHEAPKERSISYNKNLPDKIIVLNSCYPT
ncbi:Hypothetical protein POVR1_LOCUS95 [uncultured virus]|nr:Hypothetical protein POVR1_LOCUS95 [uncultured virus]